MLELGIRLYENVTICDREKFLEAVAIVLNGVTFGSKKESQKCITNISVGIEIGDLFDEMIAPRSEEEIGLKIDLNLSTQPSLVSKIRKSKGELKGLFVFMPQDAKAPLAIYLRYSHDIVLIAEVLQPVEV